MQYFYAKFNIDYAFFLCYNTGVKGLGEYYTFFDAAAKFSAAISKGVPLSSFPTRKSLE